MESFYLLGARIDPFSRLEIISAVQTRLNQKLFTHLITVNSLWLVELDRDPSLKKLVTENTLCVAESIGVVWLSRLKKCRNVERVPGIDLMQELCHQAAARGQSVYLLGAKKGVAELAAKKLQQQFPSLLVAGTAHGYFSLQEEFDVLQDIRDSGATFVFVARSMPEQEQWIHRHAQHFSGKCVMGVGGSFDVFSGQLTRAPHWMQKTGLEWFYRLIQEPRRIKRILKILPIFLK